MATIKKFKKGHVYIGRALGFGAWYIIHQEGQRSWTACNFTHTNGEGDDFAGDVVKGSSTMAEQFEKVCIFDKTVVEHRKKMRETMFNILKWGDPEGEQNQDAENDEEDDITDEINAQMAEEAESLQMNQDETYEPEPDEGGAQEVKPISVADMDMRYNFLLNLVGNAWAVQNRETEKWLLPNGEEVGRYRTFGSNKRDAYELIKQKMEKES